MFYLFSFHVEWIPPPQQLAPPSTDNTVYQDLSIESKSEISTLASFKFSEEVSRDLNSLSVSEYLSYSDNGSYSPLIFYTSTGQNILLGASEECFNGSIKLLPVGDNSFLCIFDSLVITPSKPILSPKFDADGGIISISLLLNTHDICKQKNIAFLDMEAGKAYLINKPKLFERQNSASLYFKLFDGDEDSYGYSNNRVFLLDKDGVIYTFEKDKPAKITAINHKSIKIEKNADLYTDEYAIFQQNSESSEDGENCYITVRDTTGEKTATKTVFEKDSPLDSALFRVGNNIYVKENIYNYENRNEYALKIYKVNIDEEMHISTSDEGKLYVIENNCFGVEEHPKNSGMEICTNDMTTIIRAENRYSQPLIVKAVADINGDLSDIVCLRLPEGEYFPYPISSAKFMNNSLYWINEDNSSIYIADFNDANPSITKKRNKWNNRK